MIYKLRFLPSALKEWNKLNNIIQTQFKKKLAERLVHPCVMKDQLQGDLAGCYKIKLRQVGYRLVYQALESQKVLVVITIGKRDKNIAYERAIVMLRSKK